MEQRKNTVKTLQEEIRECLVEFTPLAQGAVRAVWVFKRTFSGFKGHFPGNPVCPGVCLVAAQLCAAERMLEQRMKLREIANVKFMWPAFPDRRIEGVLSVKELDGGLRQIKSEMSVEGRPVAQFLLRVCLAEGSEK